MRYTQNALNILTTKSYHGIGNAWIVRNIHGNESVAEIVNKISSKTTVTIEEFEYKKNHFETLLQKFEGVCDGMVAIGDIDFPQFRGMVKDGEQPVFIYYKGNLDLLKRENKNISVIGLLNPSDTIAKREQKVVAEFVAQGATIVSGLAFGCDSIAHRQALISKGKTVAILPSSLDNILPTKHKDLAGEIVEAGGLLVTEYGNHFKSAMELSKRYKERDRLQALFCDTIVLAASYAQDSIDERNTTGKKLDSGARLAMGYAKDYNLPRAVMYDDTDAPDPMFDLNRRLMQESKDVSVICQDKVKECVKKIMSKNTQPANKIAYQTKLF